MRADRLVAMLLLMQGRQRVTARELAGALEVSVATARRDLEALSAAGVPVYPQAGRGGGWSLVGGARTDLSGLSAPEAQALFLMVGPAAATSPAVRSSLRKLTRALPRPFQAEAEAAASAVVVDTSPWGALAADGRNEIVGLLQTAVVRRRRVRLVYTDRAHRRSERVVDPWGLVDKAEDWYLVAGTDQGQRTFRVDRMVEAHLTDDEARRPDDFVLADAWREVVETSEARRSTVRATIAVEARHVWVLRDHFGRHLDEDAVLPDGRTRVHVAAPTALAIAQQLAGWGRLVEVLEPESVKRELARLGRELVDRYDA